MLLIDLPRVLNARLNHSREASSTSQYARLTQHDRRRFAAGAASLGLAVLLLAIKLWAWIVTGSVAVLGATVDGVVDAGASLVTLIGLLYAARPPDSEHRWGHGKAEALAALMQALFLIAAAAVVLLQALQRLAHPEALIAVAFGIWVTSVSAIAATALVIFQSWMLRDASSVAIVADRRHHIVDITANIAALAALATTIVTGWQRADPLFALGIAGFMLWNARGIAATALAVLLDRELADADRARIQAAVLGPSDVRALRWLRTRHAGDRIFIEFTIEVDGSLPVREGHAVADAAEKRVRMLFPDQTEVSVHVEPVE